MNTIDISNNETNKNFNSRLDAARIQLRGALPSDIIQVIEQAQKWLQEDLENKGIYSLLLDAVKENPDLRESIDIIIEKMIEQGSKAAREAMSMLPISIQNLVADADNAYYAAEYGKAIKLYQDILKLESDNQHARDQLAKAQANKLDQIEEKAKQFPRDAVQYFRRARSYIAANEIKSAVIFLKAAIEEALTKGVTFLDAEELLANIQNLINAEEKGKSPDNSLHKEGYSKKPQSSIPKIFISYSHKDEKYKNELITMLAPLQNQGILEIWQDRKIMPGDEWYKAIQIAMTECNVALLLISGDFLASRFIQDEELTRLLQRREEEGLRVVPIIVSECLWKRVPVLHDLGALPKDGKPVVSFERTGQRDWLWTQIVTSIEELVKPHE